MTTAFAYFWIRTVVSSTTLKVHMCSVKLDWTKYAQKYIHVDRKGGCLGFPFDYGYHYVASYCWNVSHRWKATLAIKFIIHITFCYNVIRSSLNPASFKIAAVDIIWSAEVYNNWKVLGVWPWALHKIILLPAQCCASFLVCVNLYYRLFLLEHPTTCHR